VLRRIGTLFRLRSPSALPLLVVVLAVVAANGVYLLGITDPNPVGTYGGLTTALGHKVLPGINYVDPNVGFTSQALGHRAALDWIHGHVPWWNPYEGVGAPLAGEMQSAALFPFVLFDAVSWGQVLFRLALELVAAVSTFVLLRRLVRSRWAAAAGAIVFGLNGTFSWMFHAAANPVAFLPLLLLGIEQAREGRRPSSGLACIAVALALSVYAGFPETAYIDGLMAVLWVVVRASEERGRRLAAFLGRTGAGAVTGLLLAGPILVAFLTYLPSADVSFHSRGLGGLHLDRSVDLPDLVTPYLFGPLNGWTRHDGSGVLGHFWASVGGYVGLSVVLLALVGLLGRGQRRLRVALAVWAVLVVGRMVGLPVLAPIVNAVPGASRTLFFRYSIPTLVLALIVLAVMGIDDTIAAAGRRPGAAALVGGAGVITVVLAGHRGAQLLSHVHGVAERDWWEWASIAFAGLVVAVCAMAFLAASPRLQAGLASSALVIEALALFVTPQLSAPTSTRIDTGPVRYLQAHLGTGRFYTLGPIFPNYGSYWGVASLDLNDLPIPKAYAQFITARLDPNVLPILFTGHTAASRERPGPAAQFVAHVDAYEQAGAGYLVIQSGTPLPPLPDHVDLPVVYRDSLVTIRRLPAAAALFTASGGSCRVGPTSQYGATVDCAGAGRLVYREEAMAGWAASDDGRAAPITTVEGVFQAVGLHAGRNVVRFRFAPPYAGWAELGLALGALIWVAAVADGRAGRAGRADRAEGYGPGGPAGRAGDGSDDGSEGGTDVEPVPAGAGDAEKG